MLFYLLPAGLAFAITVHALLQDCTTPNNHLGSWIFIGLATVLWPITLPSMLRKKYRDWREHFEHQPQSWSETVQKLPL